MSISVQHLTYQFANQSPLLNDISFSIPAGSKVAIVGKNGSGKSTLLKLIAGVIRDYEGSILHDEELYFMPQHYGQFDTLTIAQALGVDHIFDALRSIENGSMDQKHFDLAENNWELPARCEQAFAVWGLNNVRPDQLVSELSGGMKSKLFLSVLHIRKPAIVLLDEPTNHLDNKTRSTLFKWLSETNATVLVSSHDRELLRSCDTILQLHDGGIKTYGGNYDLFSTLSTAEMEAREKEFRHHEKTVREAKKKQQQTLERRQRADAQASKKARLSSDPKILLNTRKANAENSSAKLKDVHDTKLSELRSVMADAAAALQIEKIMKGYFDESTLHSGKVMMEADFINFAYPDKNELWPQHLSFTIRSGDRVSIAGDNGSGKSTLLQLLQGKLAPTKGSIRLSNASFVLLDQDYSMIDRSTTVLQQAFLNNTHNLQPETIHTLLAGFLFFPESWEKSCSVLSGGEMLRLSLCCMVLQNKAPDIIYLDEPVNNLDLSNIKALAAIFSSFRGTLITVSHDRDFLHEVDINSEINLSGNEPL